MTIPPGTLCIWPLAFPTAHNHTPHQAHTSTMSPIFELHYSFYPFTLKKVTEVNIEGAVLWTYSTAKPQKTKSCFLHCLSKINDLFFFFFIFLLVLCASWASSCVTFWTSFIISACISCCLQGKWWPIMYTLRKATEMYSRLLEHFQYTACMNHKSQILMFCWLRISV